MKSPCQDQYLQQFTKLQANHDIRWRDHAKGTCKNRLSEASVCMFEGKIDDKQLYVSGWMVAASKR